MAEITWSDLTNKKVTKWAASEKIKKTEEEIKSEIKALYDEFVAARKDLNPEQCQNKARFEWYRKLKSGYGPSTAILFEGIIWGPGEANDMNQYQKWLTMKDYDDAKAEDKAKMIREGRIQLVEIPNKIVEGKPALEAVALDNRKHFRRDETATEPTNPNYGKPLKPTWRRKVVGLFRPAPTPDTPDAEISPWRPGVIQLYNTDCAPRHNIQGTDAHMKLYKDGDDAVKKAMVESGNIKLIPNLLQQLVDGAYNSIVNFKARIRNTDEKQRWLIALPEGSQLAPHPGIKRKSIIPDEWTTSDAVKIQFYSGAPEFIRKSLTDLQGIYNDEDSWKDYSKDYDRFVVSQVQVMSMSDRPIGIGGNHLMTVEEPNAEDFELESTNVWVNPELMSKYDKFGPSSIIELAHFPRSGKVYDSEAKEMTDVKSLQLNAYDMVAYPEWRTEPQGKSVTEAEDVS